MEGRAWFKMFPAEYLAGDMALLTNEEFGAMIRLLFHNWIALSLPSDLNQLARLTGCPVKQMERLWLNLSRHFPEIDGSPGRLGNPGLAEYEKHRAAVASSKSRAGRTPRKSYDEHTENHPFKRKDQSRPEEPEAPPLTPPAGGGGATGPEPERQRAPKRATRRRHSMAEPTTAPDGWEVSESNQAWFRAKYGDVRKNLVIHETEQFLTHALREGKVFVDWQAAWRTWVNNWQTDFGRNVPSNGNDQDSKRPPGVPEDDPNLVPYDDPGKPSSDRIP